MPDQFWDMTYAEWGLVADGFIKRMQHSHDDRMHLAWHIAGLMRQKELPPLADLFISDKPEQKEQSAEDMINAAMLWTAALGGEVVESG